MKVIEGLILAIVSGFFLIESLKLHNNKSWALSPALFPLMITSLALLFSIILITKGLKSKDEEEETQVVNWKSTILIILLSIVYFIILPKIHFVPASIIYLFTFLYILGERNWILLGSISLAAPLLMYYIFGNLLGVLLP